MQLPAPPPEPSGSPPTRTRTLRLWDLFVIGGGLIVFFFSFAPFVEFSNRGRAEMAAAGLTSWHNAWAAETYMVPLTTFVILAGLLAAAAAAVRFGLGRNPQWLGFHLRQIELGLALFMVVVLFSMTVSEKHAIFGSGLRQILGALDEEVALVAGWGAVVMLVGAIIALAGAVLNYLGFGPILTPRPSQPAAAGPPPGTDQPWPDQPGPQQPGPQQPGPQQP